MTALFIFTERRNHVPWIIIGACYVTCMGLLLLIRYLLSNENKRRDNEPVDETFEDVYIERIGKDGELEKVKVDKVRFIADIFRFPFTDLYHLQGILGPH